MKQLIKIGFQYGLLILGGYFLWNACAETPSPGPPAAMIPQPQFSLSQTPTHNKFSRLIPPVLRVPSGAVIEVYTKEASDGQISPNPTIAELIHLEFDRIHPLSGPVYVEDAAPGDILAVTLHKVELGSWGWTAIAPGFGFLNNEFTEPAIKTFQLGKDKQAIHFSENIIIPLCPFPGVMGVAPDTDEMLSTIPPRANGGNMDDPHIREGTTVYFPVFVEGALFSIGDTHAVQGMGEVCGTAIEAPTRIIYQVRVIKGRPKIQEPHYETADIYAVTAFATTLDEAAKKATRYMIDYLVNTLNLSRNDAYMLCSLAGDLKIAEVVDAPHVLVTMHIPKKIIGKH